MIKKILLILLVTGLSPSVFSGEMEDDPLLAKVMVNQFESRLTDFSNPVAVTSLGIGDVFPMGHIRFLTGIEALNGLLLIAWSASFTFHVMGNLWPQVKCCNSDEQSAEKVKK